MKVIFKHALGLADVFLRLPAEALHSYNPDSYNIVVLRLSSFISLASQALLKATGCVTSLIT